MLNNSPACIVSDFFTTVRNVSPNTLFFGFLPPNGRRLASGESFSFFGSFDSYLIEMGVVNDRKRRSLEAAIYGDTAKDLDPVLVVVKSPAVLVYDDTLDQTKKVAVNNGALVIRDPACYEYSSSLSL